MPSSIDQQYPQAQQPKVSVRYTTNQKTIKIILWSGILFFLLFIFISTNYFDTSSIPPYVLSSFVGGFVGYFSSVLRSSQDATLRNKNHLEFYRNPIAIFLPYTFMLALLFLLTYMSPLLPISVSFPAMLISIFSLVVVAIFSTYVTASHKIILREHTMVSMGGIFHRKSTVIPYEDINAIEISDFKGSVTIISAKRNFRITRYWQGSRDIFHKILQQKIESTSVIAVKSTVSTPEELVEMRLRGLITDEELSTKLSQHYAQHP